MTYRPPNPAFAAHHTDYRMTDPEQTAEARVMDELAVLWSTPLRPARATRP